MLARTLILLVFTAGCVGQRVVESGQLQVWHTVTLAFVGPETSETARPNPFTDYRLDVTFKGPGGEFLVPGFFAADGRSVETSAQSGSTWLVRFAPNAAGRWRYSASFRTGPGVAVADDATAGQATAFDGATGEFLVERSDRHAPDFRARGRLEYVGRRYLRFAGDRTYFLKGGADSPENLLAYADFDGTRDHDGESGRRPDFLHRYEPHVRDWREGDPSWQDGKGKGLIGALNYLSSEGVNSIYFLPQNVEGDGDDTWPWIDRTTFERFDVSKLAQWETVFSHADRLGILLHVVTAETENDHLLDNGDLGPDRTLYYRELVARFGHHPALIWNLGEENTNSTQQRKAHASALRRLDPYDHPIVMHTHATAEHHERHYAPLLGFGDFEGASMQIRDDSLVHTALIEWMHRSRDAGRPWIVSFDEQRTGRDGIAPDAEDDSRHDERRDHLWATLMAGSWGIEWYFGYMYPNNDLDLEDFRSRSRIWSMTRHALDFFRENLPFPEMIPADHLASDGGVYVLADAGAIYALYIPTGGSTRLDLDGSSGRFDISWFDPREGGPLTDGGSVSGPGIVEIGPAPGDPAQDWVALLRLAEDGVHPLVGDSAPER